MRKSRCWEVTTFFYFDDLKRKICLIVVIVLSLQSVANK